ncbi:MAG: FeoA family protein [Anaerolineae bacterium]
MTLSRVRSGATARIRGIQGGHTLLSRLAALGFTPGAAIKVVQNRGRGPIIVDLRGTRLALGRGEASKIVVEEEAGSGYGR